MKACLITGAGARLGRHMALGLAKEGWAIALHYNRSLDGAQSTADEICASGGQAIIVQANLNVPAQRDSLIERANKTLGHPLTALINNASTFSHDSISDMSDALFDHNINANLRAPLHLISQFAKHVQENGQKKGCVINMIDQRVLNPSPDFLSYSLAKSALYEATKTLARALAPHIRVNGVGPGPTLQSVHQSLEDFQAEAASTLLGYGSTPDDILQTALYLLNAKAVTGQMIAVDAGQHLGVNPNV